MLLPFIIHTVHLLLSIHSLFLKKPLENHQFSLYVEGYCTSSLLYRRLMEEISLLYMFYNERIIVLYHIINLLFLNIFYCFFQQTSPISRQIKISKLLFIFRHLGLIVPSANFTHKSSNWNASIPLSDIQGSLFLRQTAGISCKPNIQPCFPPLCYGKLRA